MVLLIAVSMVLSEMELVRMRKDKRVIYINTSVVERVVQSAHVLKNVAVTAHVTKLMVNQQVRKIVNEYKENRIIFVQTTSCCGEHSPQHEAFVIGEKMYRIKYLTSLLMFVLSFACSPCRGESLPDAKELVTHYKSATSWDNTISMRLEVEMNLVSDRRGPANRTYNFVYRRDNGRTEWFGNTELLINDTTNFDSSNEFVRVINDKYYLDAHKGYKAEEFNGEIKREFKQQQKVLLKDPSNGGFLDGTINNIGATTKIAERLYESENLKIVGKDVIDGVETFAVESTTQYGKITAWIAPGMGYNALKYSIIKESDDIIKESITVHQEGLTNYSIYVGPIEFRKINEVFVPISGRYVRQFQRLDGKEEKVSYTVKRHEIDLNPDFEALGAFKFHLPDGSKIWDSDHPGISFKIVGEGLVPDVDYYILDVINSEVKNLTSSKDSVKVDVKNKVGSENVINKEEQLATNVSLKEDNQSEKNDLPASTLFRWEYLFVVVILIAMLSSLGFYIHNKKD